MKEETIEMKRTTKEGGGDKKQMISNSEIETDSLGRFKDKELEKAFKRSNDQKFASLQRVSFFSSISLGLFFFVFFVFTDFFFKKQKQKQNKKESFCHWFGTSQLEIGVSDVQTKFSLD